MSFDEEITMMEDNTFTVVDEDGNERVCDILFTFDSPDTGKSYIAYTDGTKDEEGCEVVYASIYDPTNEDDTLQPIETEEEWAMIENVLENLMEEYGPDDE